MNFKDELQSAAEAVASNPKVLGGVAAATTSLGAASWTDVISGGLSMMAIIAGIIATTLLGRVHWAAYKNHILQNKIFRQQLIALGGDPDKDE